jgi:hypothetical protein
MTQTSRSGFLSLRGNACWPIWQRGMLHRPDERLRYIRAVAVLEYIGSPDACTLLNALARGAPEARLTQEAMGAAERADKRQTPSR